MRVVLGPPMCDLHFILCLLWSWLPMCGAGLPMQVRFGAGCPCVELVAHADGMELVAPISQAQKCGMRMTVDGTHHRHTARGFEIACVRQKVVRSFVREERRRMRGVFVPRPVDPSSSLASERTVFGQLVGFRD